MTNAPKKLKLRPASENLWYNLATIVGEPMNRRNDDETWKANRRYWNGWWQAHAEPDSFAELYDANGDPIELPALDDHELEHVRTVLRERGFEPSEAVEIPHIFDLSKLEFPECAFIEFVWIGDVDFSEAVFTSHANLENSIFSGHAYFTKVEFLGYSYFGGVVFSGDAYFERAFFLDQALFQEVIFSRAADFEKVIFSSFSDFSDSELSGASRFDNVVFEKHPPFFFQAEVHQDTDWLNFVPPRIPDDIVLADVHGRAYECLSHIMSLLNKPHDAHMFFRAGMRTRRVTETHWLPRAINWTYEFTCNYGHGVGRAAGNLAGLWLLGTLLLYSLVFLDPWKEDLVFSWSEFLRDIAGAAAISCSNVVSFLGLSRIYLDDTFDRFQRVSEGGPGEFSDAAIDSFNIIGGFQSILGVISVFFLLLTLRNRFKMQ